MRCLLVEDEKPRIDAIFGKLEAAFGVGAVDVAEDRDSAIDLISARPYDLVVLDQRIPSGPGQLNADVDHGRAVLEYIRGEAPHTVVYFLTALPMDDEYVDIIVAQGEKLDIYGDRKPVPLVLRFRKAQLDPFFAAVESLVGTARVTHHIEINTKGKDLGLNEEEARLIRCFGRLQDGICVDVEPINDGLSGARVVKADVKASDGQIRMWAVGKLGKHADIASEMLRYEKEVMRLPSGSYAPLLIPGQARVLGRMAAFYRLLAGYDRTIFDVLRASDPDAAACVKVLQEAEEAWAKQPIVRKDTVFEHAKRLIWEDRFPAIHSLIPEIDCAGYEAKAVSVNLCTRHGDLHGENARVDAKLRVMMLDYGSVDLLPSAIDAITMELSPFFHPHGHRDLLKWKPEDGPIDWFDVEAFAALTAVPEYVKACRVWAHKDAFGNREVLVCAYTYVMRQLQYPGADVALARAILPSIIARGMAA
ncbi:hypothetical protein [Sphingomonas sp.]|jgi:CheY-like chemotaxis protein|uniref:hypothetical protein n=1 Tax=Sphingomonas sp. TaxID=28214 RepID=UPI002E158978|nr:hypothetical protein [Sphingomonas sp.]